MRAEVWDDRPCDLGEGALWHPGLQRLYWFDILGRRLLWREGGTPRGHRFDRMCSAAGWIDDDRLLVAGEGGLFVLRLSDGTEEPLAPLEADRPLNRPNDGRADPSGGFWIGTMGKAAEPGAGAIYRWHSGELRRLHAGIGIPNAICFAPDGERAYFADSLRRVVYRQRLDAQGWPVGEAESWLDLRAAGVVPDGAVTDAAGNLWSAQWGAGRVAAYGPDGNYLGSVAVGGRHASCPAFGGDDGATLFCTTARQGLSADEIARSPGEGMTYACAGVATGRPEPAVRL